MTTEVNCGQVRGPVQLNFARSIDPIAQKEITITRQAITKEGEDKTTEMGRKHIVPYGLYKTEGYISANLAQDTKNDRGEITKYGTGFSEDDLELLFESIENMFEHDHAAARGKMAVRKLIVFKHESKFGNTQSHKLFNLINVKKIDENKPARAFSDYEVTVNRENVPQGVEIIERI
jgi:CRISPR-associated protein Csd2